MSKEVKSRLEMKPGGDDSVNAAGQLECMGQHSALQSSVTWQGAQRAQTPSLPSGFLPPSKLPYTPQGKADVFSASSLEKLPL